MIKVQPTKNLKRNALIPAIIILVCLVVGGAMGGLNIGIDFTGGTLVTLDLKQSYEVKDIEDATAAGGIKEMTVSKSQNDKGEPTVAIIRMRSEADEAKEEQTRTDIVTRLQDKYPNVTVVTSGRVGAVAGRDLLTNAMMSLLIASILMLAYICIRFEWRQGVVAVGGLILDLILMVSVMMVCRNFVQINSSFIAAILTVVGYDINNTIVVFDRVRENRKLMANRVVTRKEIVDRSVNETLTRTINSSVTTLITITMVYILGVPSIREFSLPIIVGILSGLYTSIFLSASVWGVWSDKARENSRGVKTKSGSSKSKKKA